MKRSGINRGTKGLTRSPMKRGRKPIPHRSAKREAELDEREEVRRIVLERDGGCIAVDLVPEVRCGSPDVRRPALEVDELRGGSWRSIEYLDPDACNTLCQNHHDWKTSHKRDFIARLEARRTPDAIDPTVVAMPPHGEGPSVDPLR